MRWIFKTAGLVMIFVCCLMAGILKSRKLFLREKGLVGVKECFEELSSRLMYERLEKERLLKATFIKRGIAKFSQEKTEIVNDNLSVEDKRILNEFFSSFGSADIKSEYDRIQLYRELSEQNLKLASKENSDLSRLYKTLGACVGIAVCIILY